MGYMENVFGEEFLDKVIDWIKDNYEPDDIFDEGPLVAWARENGYVLEEE